MKEIDYENPSFEREEVEWERKKEEKISKIPAMRNFHVDKRRAEEERQRKEKDQIRRVEMPQHAEQSEAYMESYPTEDDGAPLGKMIFFLVILFAFVLGVGIYVIIGTRLGTPLNTATTTDITLPVADTTDTVTIDLADSPREQVLADISIVFDKTHLAAGKKRTIQFSSKNISGNSGAATAEDFFSATAEQKISDALTQSIEDTFNYEIYSSTTLRGVITLTSRSYPNTFAAMLDWEAFMAKDLVPVLDPFYDRKQIKNLDRRTFHDIRLGGFDTRTLADQNGNIILSYAFADKKTLLIAGTNDTLLSALLDHTSETN